MSRLHHDGPNLFDDPSIDARERKGRKRERTVGIKEAAKALHVGLGDLAVCDRCGVMYPVVYHPCPHCQCLAYHLGTEIEEGAP